MKMTVYTQCYNEEYLIPFFVNHYKQFADRIVIYDNESTDNSVAVAKALGCEVRTFSTANTCREDIQTKLRNTCWKECKYAQKHADLVCVCDIDEFIYHKDLLTLFNKMLKDNYTHIYPIGYHMVSRDKSHDISKQLYDFITTGVPDNRYNKTIVFNPHLLREINFATGSHTSRPIGKRVKALHDGFLLHFCRISLQDTLERYAKRIQRMSLINKKNNWGIHYCVTEQSLEYELEAHIRGALPITEFSNHEKFNFITVKYKDIDGVFKCRNGTGDELTVDEVWKTNEYFDNYVKIDKGDIVVDIGANIGTFSILAYKLGAAKVIAYEPFHEHIELAEMNARINLTDIDFNEYAVWDNCDIQLNVPVVPEGKTKNSPWQCVVNTAASSFFSLNRHSKSYDVPAKNINTILDNFEVVNFLKLDCEGAEHKIFATISTDNLKKIKKIAMEVHNFNNTNDNDILNLLRSNGFTISYRINKGQFISVIRAYKP